VDQERAAIRALAIEIATGQLDPLVGARCIAEAVAQLSSNPGSLGVFAVHAQAGDCDAIFEEATLLLGDIA
jgi:hypothetical protein